MATRQSDDPSMPPGAACDVVTVPTRQGLEAVDILRRASSPGDGMGPVLHDDGDDTLGFVVPAGTAAAWDVPGSTCTGTDGRGLRLAPAPAPGARTGWCRPARPTWRRIRRPCGGRWARRPG